MNGLEKSEAVAQAWGHGQRGHWSEPWIPPRQVATECYGGEGGKTFLIHQTIDSKGFESG